MVVHDAHPLVSKPPFARCWKRSDRRRAGRGPEAHRELVVLHALSGEARYLVDGHVHVLRRGAVLWAFSGQTHVLLTDSDDFDMWVFLVSERLLAAESGAGLPPLRVPPTGGVAPRIINEVATQELSRIAEVAQTSPSTEAAGVAIRWWLLRAWGHWQAAAQADGRRVHPAVDRAARALRTDPSLTLTALSRDAGLSAGRLSKVFQRDLGQGVAEFRTEQRLILAERIYRGGRQTLMAAALDAGFRSYTQFFRAFRTRYGTGPREYYANEKGHP